MPGSSPSIFDIFGPVMVGPSSSHTAGVAKIACLARRMFPYPLDHARVRFYGSLAMTYRGHGSDKAAISGLLGMLPEDERLHGSLAIAEGSGLSYEIVSESHKPMHYHPNTVVIELSSGEKRFRVRAASIGGGEIRIQSVNGFKLSLSGELDALLVLHHDEVGVIAVVTRILADEGINIARTGSFRKEKGEEALLIIEVDGSIGKSVIDKIRALSPVRETIYAPALGGR